MEGNLKRVVFARSPLMSSYLVAFAVGPFKHIEARTNNGCVVRIYAPTDVTTDGQFSLDCAVKALNYYDDLYVMLEQSTTIVIFIIELVLVFAFLPSCSS
jgi:puromycin-sensitive aminopeptidase